MKIHAGCRVGYFSACTYVCRPPILPLWGTALRSSSRGRGRREGERERPLESKRASADMQAGIRRTATVAAARDAFSTSDSVAELKNCNMSIISTNRTVSSLVE